MHHKWLVTAMCSVSVLFARPPSGKIEVVGTGTLEIAPDLASVTVGASYTDSTVEGAVERTEKAISRIMAVGSEMGIDSADIETGQFRIRKDFRREDGKQVLRGYEATNMLDITVRQLPKLEELLSALMDTEITTVRNVSFGHTGKDSLEKAASLLALTDAAELAGAMCKQMNVDKGPLLYMSNYTEKDDVRPLQALERTAASSGVTIRPRTVTVTRRVYVAFGIE